MLESSHNTVYLKDYCPPEYLINAVELRFELDPSETHVKSLLTIERNKDSQSQSSHLQLDGVGLTLCSIALNNQPLQQSEYELNQDGILIKNVPDSFTLRIENTINPQANTALTGLYMSSGMYCTQCEAHGFRHITYYLDRPEVLAQFNVTIVADKNAYPQLLSNGNFVESGQLEGDKHWAKWSDPFPKPSYLFALVAGDFYIHEQAFVTMSGREVTLQIIVEKENFDKCEQAMHALQSAMKWDEQTYGREYDLDIYMIVAVNDFNMGAMENKGLNIFNSKFVLANSDAATDQDYKNIMAVVGHEYFHNWSGNRVTCRDWFQLSLKEGLTIFREQGFCQAMYGEDAQRIESVRALRSRQFPEDAGPMAHPVRPESYMEINNFYTSTVYEKGSEVIRMMREIIGVEHFRKAMDYYFEKYDGKAATIVDFIEAMETTSNVDLLQFRLWYSQAGTPELFITSEYDDARRLFTLNIKQLCPATPGQALKEDMHIPVKVALYTMNGEAINCRLSTEAESELCHEKLLHVTESQNTFAFVDVDSYPVPSILRGFTAPVKVHYPYTSQDLQILIGHDSNGFNRWDAMEQLLVKHMIRDIRLLDDNGVIKVDADIIDLFKNLLSDEQLDKDVLVQLLTLPSQAYLAENMPIINVEGIHFVREIYLNQLARHCKEHWCNVYNANRDTNGHSHDKATMQKRSLANLALLYLTRINDDEHLELAFSHFKTANNMTDKMAALYALNQIDCEQRQQALDMFCEYYASDELALDKWFALQASCYLPGTVNTVIRLMGHPKFNYRNPNRVRSVLSVFTINNAIQFHNIDGSGYSMLADQVIKVDKMNPQLSARLVEPLIRWGRFDDVRAGLMKQELGRILGVEGLSLDCYEVCSKGVVE